MVCISKSNTELINLEPSNIYTKWGVKRVIIYSYLIYYRSKEEPNIYMFGVWLYDVDKRKL